MNPRSLSSRAISFFRSPWVAGLAFVLGLTLGPGSLWRLRETTTLSRSADIELTRLSLDARGRLNDLLLKSIELSSLYYDLSECDASNATYAVENKRAEVGERLRLVEADAVSIEGQLAKLEGRVPRPIRLTWVPPGPPGDITVEEVLPSGRHLSVAQSEPRKRPACPQL